MAAAPLLPLGLWLCMRTARPAVAHHPRPSSRFITSTALAVGVVGGIGGGSLLSPVLAGRGIPLAEVAPAALTSTLPRSIVGAGTYIMLAAITGEVHVAPDWAIGISCGTGGLAGCYLGAHLQPVLPEWALRFTLGGSAAATALVYTIQAL